jgi:hypothetical protein
VPLQKQPWSDIELLITLGIPTTLSKDSRDCISVGFCKQEGGEGYEIQVSRSTVEVLRICLMKVGTDDTILLEELLFPDAQERFHSIRLVRIGEEINVNFDGLNILTVLDHEFSEGGVVIASRNIEGAVFGEVEIRPLELLEEHFLQDELRNWSTTNDTWKVSLRGDDSAGSATYLASAAKTSFSLPKWSVPDEYSLKSRLRVETARRAGTMFNYEDREDYNAFVLGHDPKNPLLLKAMLLEVRNAESRLLWESEERFQYGQWHALSLTRSPGYLTLAVNGHHYPVFAMPSNLGGEAIGLMAAEGVANFDSFILHGYAPPAIQQFDFEPEYDERMLSQWHQVSGRFELGRHPAILHMQCSEEGDEAKLRLRESLPKSFQTTFKISPLNEPELHDLSSADFALPSLPSVLVLGEPSLGLLLMEKHGRQNRFLFLLDAASLSSLIVFKNDTEVARLPYVLTSLPGEDGLVLSFIKDTLRVGLPNGREFEVSYTPDQKDITQAYWDLAVVGKDLNPGDTIRVSTVLIEPVISLRTDERMYSDKHEFKYPAIATPCSALLMSRQTGSHTHFAHKPWTKTEK